MSTFQQELRALAAKIEEWQRAVRAHETERAHYNRIQKHNLENKVYMTPADWSWAQELASRASKQATEAYGKADALKWELTSQWFPRAERMAAPDLASALELAYLIGLVDANRGSALARRAMQEPAKNVADFATRVSYFEKTGQIADAINTARQGWRATNDRTMKDTLARLLEKAGRIDELGALLADVQGTASTISPEAVQRIANGYLQSREVRKAVAFLDSEIGKSPDVGSLRVYRQTFLVDALLDANEAVSRSVADHLQEHPDDQVARRLAERLRTEQSAERRLEILKALVQTQGADARPYLWEALAGGHRETIAYAAGALGGEDSRDPAAKFAKRLFKEQRPGERKAIISALETAAKAPRQSLLEGVLLFALVVALTLAIGGFMAVVVSGGLAERIFHGVRGVPASLDAGLLSQAYAVAHSGPRVNPSNRDIRRVHLAESFSSLDPRLVVGVLPFLAGYLLNLAFLPLGRKLGAIGSALASLASAAVAIVISCTLLGVLGIGVVPWDFSRRGVQYFRPAGDALASGSGLWPLALSGSVLGVGAAWVLVRSRQLFARRRVARILRDIR